MDRANDVWIEELRQPGPRREAALADLRADVLRGMRSAGGAPRVSTMRSLRTLCKRRF